MGRAELGLKFVSSFLWWRTVLGAWLDWDPGGFLPVVLL